MYKQFKRLDIFCLERFFSLLFGFLLILIFVCGCSPFILQQSPEPLPKGKTSVGGGVMGMLSTDELFESMVLPTVTLRKGISKNIDVGFMGFIFPTENEPFFENEKEKEEILFITISTDLKIRIFNYGKFNFSIDPQFYFISLGHENKFLFIPNILFGKKEIFGAIKFMRSEEDFFIAPYVGSEVKIGRFKVIIDAGIVGYKDLQDDKRIKFPVFIVPEFGVHF